MHLLEKSLLLNVNRIDTAGNLFYVIQEQRFRKRFYFGNGWTSLVYCVA